MNKDLLFEVKDLHLAITRKLCNIIKKNNDLNSPSPLQAKILGYLIKYNDKKVYQKDLENILNVSRATVSEALTIMEKNNIIKRIISPNDARAKQIVLTEHSMKRYNEMKKNLKIINNKLIEGISEDEQKLFLKTLNKMKENMKK